MAGDTGWPESEDREDDRAPFVRKLRTEIRGWEAEGIISAEQSTAILGLYDATPESPARIVPSRVVSVIAVMGAALVGLGIIAAVAANWSAIPMGTRLVMMAVGTPALYFAGWLLIQRWGFNRIGISCNIDRGNRVRGVNSSDCPDLPCTRIQPQPYGSLVFGSNSGRVYYTVESGGNAGRDTVFRGCRVSLASMAARGWR